MPSFKKLYLKITKAMPDYCNRPSQLQMIEQIAECFSNVDVKNKDGHNFCLIEAPTGTGKSLAYLIAGIKKSQELGKKLIISTATKTLQSQLVEKDIPAFIKYSEIDVNYSLAKGRSNYLCPYQLELSLQNGAQGDLLNATSKTFIQLEEIKQEYQKKTWNGDLDQSPIFLDSKIKPLITTDKERCLGYSCPYNPKEESNCPYFINRERMKSSEVIVTNHSLLLADLALGGGNILPVKPEDYLLCIDEGHNLPSYAIHSFTASFELKHAINSCQNLAKLIYNPQNKSYIFTDIGFCDELHQKTNSLIDSLEKMLFILIQNIAVFIDKRLIVNDYINEGISQEFKDCFVELAYISAEVLANLATLQEKLKDKFKLSQEFLLENDLNRLGFYLSIVDKIVACSNYMINEDNSRYNANAKWIDWQQNKNGDEFVIFAGLTYIGKELFDKLWAKVYASIITSATLALGEDFSYYQHKLGLNLYPNVKALKLATSFNYTNQSQIVVPRFKFAPDYKTRHEFTQELITYLAKTLNYSEGFGTLVLFFNKIQLQETYQMLPKDIQLQILCQTEYLNNQKLIREHKQRIDKGSSSIIFGLNSFAEGVDLPSIYCMHVIITKIPFETPKDPQNMVQEYWVRFEKGSFFMEVSLPEAGIKLIQAVGRLIRNEKDFGQVSICDNRLVNKPYGLKLLDAVPPFNRKYNSNFIKESFIKLSKGCVN